MFQMAGGAITWSSKRQPIVSSSSTEAEYKALSDGAREGVWIKRLMREIGIDQDQVKLKCTDSQIISDMSESKLVVNCDNQSAIKLAHNPVFHARTKHIEIQHHFIRERILDGEIDVQYIPTGNQTADILTKPLPKPAFELHRVALGIVDTRILHYL